MAGREPWWKAPLSRALPKLRDASVTTGWQADEIVVTRAGQPVERLRASDIDRVTLVHSGEGESPGEIRAVIFETTARAVLLSADTGIAGRVLFERQAYWAQRNCIYWINERRVSWPSNRAAARWPFASRQPQHGSLAPPALAAVLNQADLTGPHTWEQRKQRRIERRRPFRGGAPAAAHATGSALS